MAGGARAGDDTVKVHMGENTYIVPARAFIAFYSSISRPEDGKDAAVNSTHITTIREWLTAHVVVPEGL